jgi:hypothetical protein
VLEYYLIVVTHAVLNAVSENVSKEADVVIGNRQQATTGETQKNE